MNYFVYKYCWSTSWNSKYKSYFIFSLTTGTVKKLLNIIRNKKKKHEKILMLDKSKVNSIKTSISKAFIDMEKIQVQF